MRTSALETALRLLVDGRDAYLRELTSRGITMDARLADYDDSIATLRRLISQGRK